jgi:NAD(P)-dependent dehydrogenase (short-subunit alcohol dehydrogenase family)
VLSRRGADIAAALAERGRDCVITSRSADRASEAAGRMKDEHGVEAIGVAMEVRSLEEVAAASQASFDWKGRIDVLVNDAGGGSGATAGDLFERPVDAIPDLLDTNLLGTILCCREFGRHMVRARRR